MMRRPCLLIAAFWLTLPALLPAADAPPADSPVRLGDPVEDPGPVTVVVEAKHDLSPPFTEIRFLAPRARLPLEEEVMHRRPLGSSNTPDAALQTAMPRRPAAMPSVTDQFDGMTASTSGCACAPPDTNAEVGPHHVLEMANGALQVSSKTGTSLLPARTP